METTNRTKGNEMQQDRIVVMLRRDGKAGGKVLGWVDGNAIVHTFTTRREIAWYTDQEVVNSKGDVVPVEVLR